MEMKSSMKLTKRALLVGINQYPNLEPRYQLSGCVNDGSLMADILRNHFGFPEANLTVLTDAEATRDGILNALDTLVTETYAGDIIAIYYSGHGSQRTDLEGDEPDGLDETIVPYDSGRHDHPNRDITDDEIYLRLLGLAEKTPHVTLIFDCCHSGTITRDAFGAKERWIEPDLRPAEALGAAKMDLGSLKAANRETGPSGWLPLGKRYVLIAGCRDDESAFEYPLHRAGETLTHGALTYFLGEELVKAVPESTYRDIFERVSARVSAVYPRQHPQMEGACDRVLLDVHDIQPMRFVPVVKCVGNRVTLGAGAAHGVTAGSQWAIYPPATKKVTGETPRNGLVEIETVRAVTCDAAITGAAKTIAAGDRAVEEAHFYGEMRLVIELKTPAGFNVYRDELVKLVGASALLRMAGEQEAGDLCVYILPPRETVRSVDPAPQLGAIGEAMWAVVGQDGRLAMPAHPITQAGVRDTLRDNLEKAARYRQALALKNVNQDSLLKGQVEFVLKQHRNGNTWIEVEPDNQSGEILYEEGDRIAIQITNHFEKPVYISILDFGLTGAISILHPVEGAREQLAPGKSIEVGVRTGDEIELYMPDDFPYTPDPADSTPTSGRETFKLFATTHEADFRPLIQGGYRNIQSQKGAGTPLGKLLELALTGCGTRDASRNRVPPDEEWTTLERSFILRKK
jgi:hypothetical protein